MRISIDHDDPGYQTLLEVGGPGPGIEAFLDGQPVQDCVTADVRLGYVTVLVRGADGRFLLDKSRGSVQRKKLFGKVEIRVSQHES